MEIAELRNVKQYLTFNNLQRTNTNTYNLNRTLNKSSFAFDLGLDTTPKREVKDYAHWEIWQEQVLVDGSNLLLSRR